MPADFLRTNKAVFAGSEFVPQYGPCTKWAIFLENGTAITFFFDEFLTLSRWDLVSSGLQTGVQTFYTNLRVLPIPASVFDGRGTCPPDAPCQQK